MHFGGSIAVTSPRPHGALNDRPHTPPTEDLFYLRAALYLRGGIRGALLVCRAAAGRARRRRNRLPLPDLPG